MAICPPSDRSHAMNNTLKSLDATSEIDRQRGTQILDYLIKQKH
jgi:hypothetical protein